MIRLHRLKGASVLAQPKHESSAHARGAHALADMDVVASKPAAADQFNLAGARVVVLDRTQASVDLLAGVLGSFGVRELNRCTSVDDAQAAVRMRAIDLLFVDPTADDGGGYEFVRWLRHSKLQPACFSPVLLVVGHARVQELARARDAGANFLIAKPIVPKVLLQRILWVARTPRLFISRTSYIGPDRRFRDEGPPLGVKGRRSDDHDLEI